MEQKNSPGLGKQALTSVGWTSAATYINAFVSFGGNLLLARLLAPDDFGIYALASSFLALVSMVAGFGSQQSIVQCREEGIRHLIPTAFWMTIVLAFGLTVAGTLLGLLLSANYGQTIGALIVLLSWINLVNMISSTYGAVLQRELIYRPIALVQTMATLLSFGLAVLVAYRNWGVWSLFVREGTQALFVLAGLAWSSGYRLRFEFDWQAARWIWDFGWKMMGSRISQVLLERVDKLVIGTFMGTTVLGHYSLAYRLAYVGHQFSQGVVASVSFSTFATIQKERHKLGLAFERVYYWLFRLALLFGLLVWFCGYQLVVVIYGAQWQLAGSVFQNMSIFLMLLPLNSSLKIFLIASAHINDVLKASVWQLGFFIPAVFIVGYWGNLIWVVWALNASMLLIWLLMIRYVSSAIPVNWGYAMRPPLVAGMISLVCIEFISQQVARNSNLLMQVLSNAILVIALFSFLLYLMERKTIKNEWRMIRAKLK